MKQVLIAKIQARDKFFELWSQCGQAIANDPASWQAWQQAITRADSPLAQQLHTAIDQLGQAHDAAAKAGF